MHINMHACMCNEICHLWSLFQSIHVVLFSYTHTYRHTDTNSEHWYYNLYIGKCELHSLTICVPLLNRWFCSEWTQTVFHRPQTRWGTSWGRWAPPPPQHPPILLPSGTPQASAGSDRYSTHQQHPPIISRTWQILYTSNILHNQQDMTDIHLNNTLHNQQVVTDTLYINNTLHKQQVVTDTPHIKHTP